MNVKNNVLGFASVISILILRGDLICFSHSIICVENN